MHSVKPKASIAPNVINAPGNLLTVNEPYAACSKINPPRLQESPPDANVVKLHCPKWLYMYNQVSIK